MSLSKPAKGAILFSARIKKSEFSEILPCSIHNASCHNGSGQGGRRPESAATALKPGDL